MRRRATTRQWRYRVVAGLCRLVGAYGYGIAADTDAIARTLEGIALDEAGMALELDLGRRSRLPRARFASLANRKGMPARAADIRFGLDPVGNMAAVGAAPMRWTETAPTFGRLVADLAGAGCKGPFAVADGRQSTTPEARRRRSSGSCLRVAPAICVPSKAPGLRSMTRGG